MKRLLILSIFFLPLGAFAQEIINYTITSDSQINTLEGDLQAIGNDEIFDRQRLPLNHILLSFL